MKHFFLACLFPALLTAENMQLTEQLGKTVLYGDIALSPDGKNVAWVQSTAATTAKQTYIRGTSENSPATLINLATTGERIDANPAWSPDSKMLAFFPTRVRSEVRAARALDWHPSKSSFGRSMPTVPVRKSLPN